jgi:hypothetical protein
MNVQGIARPAGDARNFGRMSVHVDAARLLPAVRPAILGGMGERDDYCDHDPLPWWARPSSAYLAVLAVVALGAVVVFYAVLPILIPGFVTD